MAIDDSNTGKIAAQEIWLRVFGEKLDDIIHRLEKMEERFETRLDSESKELHSHIMELDKRVRTLEMQRWVLGGAAVAGGTGGIGALLKMFAGV